MPELRKRIAIWHGGGLLTIISDATTINVYQTFGIVLVHRAGVADYSVFNRVTQITSYYGKQGEEE